MKYLEEANTGDTFAFNNEYFILTCDFKSNGQKLCVNLKNGLPKWLDAHSIINIEPIYLVNNEGTTLPIK